MQSYLHNGDFIGCTWSAWKSWRTRRERNASKACTQRHAKLLKPLHLTEDLPHTYISNSKVVQPDMVMMTRSHVVYHFIPII